VLFRILFGLGALALAGLAWFFVAGLRDGSVSGGNIGLWAGLLGAPALVLAGAAALKAGGRPRLASLALLPVVLPAVVLGLVMLVLALGAVHWR
jgi:ABC-type spermidine/putrescine transport system permease subunit II